ncbi:DUF3040 domain-containing protein [Naasia lichenicola]|uniref:DUF3040 domain-containing protein n=1 Tax=Naasia lichenicola TaxID=2565933 RepID=A0A4S4FT23_9MICO|nr:DUF3040 domain-containing protein [Naasia lichenicola]THG33471.1 DUF3040 domain-containing protein [Naasia lichenicola]
MPLSEQEQRLLDEMERSLYQNDADFVASVGGAARGRMSYTSLVSGILLAVGGVVVLVAGVVFRQPFIGVLGFALMFAGVLVAIGSPRKSSTPHHLRPGSGPAPAGRRSKSSSSFMDRLNERWDKRQGGGLR